MEKLALLGGEALIQEGIPKELLKWPILTQEDIDAAMDVVVNNRFSGSDITVKFQEEFAEWQGSKYALAFTNGTMSLTAAMFAIGLGAGDEIICPTKTYWASISQAMNFGATVVFCNVNDMLSMDPDDLERCITPKTKAIMVVHYLGYPCDMDRIMEIARKHDLRVIEDVSHAHGSLYKGKKVGTFGDVAAMSMMSWKLFAAGEMGMLVTDDRKIYERALAYGHHDRNNEKNIIESEDLKEYMYLPLGGVKGRVNQICATLGRGQLKHFDERCAEIRKAMNAFMDELEKIPGLKPLRTDGTDGSTMGGFYMATVLYDPDVYGGLSAKRFSQAVDAEFGGSFTAWEGGNRCLHTHPLFQTYDFFKLGKPSRIAFADRDVREDDRYLKPSEEKCCFTIPWFKHYDAEWIEKCVAVYRKVAENYEQLLEGDDDKSRGGRWGNAGHDKKKAEKKS